MRDFDVGQTVVAPLVRVGEPGVVETKRRQQGGVQIVDRDDLLDRGVAEGQAWTIDRAVAAGLGPS